MDGLVVLSRSESEGESEMLALGDDDVLARTAHEDLRGCETYDLDGFRESDEETLDHAMGPCALAFPLRYEPEVEGCGGKFKVFCVPHDFAIRVSQMRRFSGVYFRKACAHLPGQECVAPMFQP